MITISISEGIELVIVDDGGICLKDLFNNRAIGILPKELDAMIEAFVQAKNQTLKKVEDEDAVEYLVEEMPSHYQDEKGNWIDENEK